MGSSLVSQELLLIFHATVLSPKQMADQAIRPLCRRPLHGRATLCGCEGLFTSREVFVYYPLQKKALSEIYSMDYLSNVGFFVRTEHWTPSINVRGNRYVAVNDHLGCNWVFLTKCGAIKWKPLTHTHTPQSGPFVMDYDRCSHFVEVTKTQQCSLPFAGFMFSCRWVILENMINSSSSSGSPRHRIDYRNSGRGRWRERQRERCKGKMNPRRGRGWGGGSKKTESEQRILACER